jgi:hypothetical protein
LLADDFCGQMDALIADVGPAIAIDYERAHLVLALAAKRARALLDIPDVALDLQHASSADE